MHRSAGLLCSGAVGAAAGVTLALLGGVAASLPLALLAVGATLAVSLLLVWTEDRRDRQQLERERVRARQARYDQHAGRLHREVFSRLSTVRLCDIGAEPPPADGVGLVVDGGTEGVDLRSLLGWPEALAHLVSDPEVASAWEEMRGRIRLHLHRRRDAHRSLQERVATEVLREYGLPTGLDGGPLRALPWCDVEALSELILRNPARGARIEAIGLDGPGGDATTGGPFALRWGDVEVMRTGDAAQADPVRLTRVIDRVTPREASVTRLRSERQEVDHLVERFRKASRRYADRVALGGSFRGSCEICRSWRTGGRAAAGPSEWAAAEGARGPDPPELDLSWSA